MTAVIGPPQGRRYPKGMSESILLITSLGDLIQSSPNRLETACLANCAIHVLTMRFLGIRYLPICYTYISKFDELPEDMLCQEELDEMLNEDRLLIDQLHALDEEFAEEFRRQNVSITEFLYGYWLKRMKQVRRDLDTPLSDDEKRGLLEVGVVLGENEATGLDSDLTR